jgi:hypothetical protein
MKKTKISMLALAILAGGTLAVSAVPAPEVLTAYSLNAQFTNAQADVWSVDGGVFTTNVAPSDVLPGFSSFSGTVFTDGSGKITGTTILVGITNNTGSPFAAFLATISGKVSATVPGTPTITMTIKGAGYVINSNGVARAANANLKFVSSGTPASGATRAAGTLTGTVNIVGAKGHATINQGAFVSASDNLPFNANPSLVVQSSKGKIVILDPSFTGTGFVKGGNNPSNYLASVKGIGLNIGSMIKFSGVEGSYTNISFGGTNTFSAPTNAILATGSKIKGQAISGTASTVTANLLTSGNGN